MKILVTDKDSIPHLQADIIELATILGKLRLYTKKWENEYGSAAKNLKKEWEAKADKWLATNIEHQPTNTPGIEK